MYFWRINYLKQDLRKGKITLDQVFWYMVAIMSAFYLYVILLVYLSDDLGIFEWPFLFIILAIKLIGMYQVCQHSKQNFFIYYFSIKWVETVRFVVFGLTILILGIFAIELLIRLKHLHTIHAWWAAIFIIIWFAMLYGRVVYHVRSLK